VDHGDATLAVFIAVLNSVCLLMANKWMMNDDADRSFALWRLHAYLFDRGCGAYFTTRKYTTLFIMRHNSK